MNGNKLKTAKLINFIEVIPYLRKIIRISNHELTNETFPNIF